MSKASTCLQDPKHVQERLEIISIQKACERKRARISALKTQKAKLKKELERSKDPAKQEKLKRDIDCISKDIDERTQEERDQHKAGCERVKTFNTLAFKRARDQDRLPRVLVL